MSRLYRDTGGKGISLWDARFGLCEHALLDYVLHALFSTKN